MTHTLKTATSAIAFIGLVALAPISAEARGLQGHFPETKNNVSVAGAHFDDRTNAQQSVTRARVKRSGTIVQSFNEDTFGHRTGSRPTLSEIQRQRRDGVEYFNR